MHSFEAPVELCLPGEEGVGSFPGVFIRAPWVEELGLGVQAIASCEGRIVGVKQGPVLGVAFHPELTEDTRLHAYFLRLVAAQRQKVAAALIAEAIYSGRAASSRGRLLH